MIAHAARVQQLRQRLTSLALEACPKVA